MPPLSDFIKLQPTLLGLLGASVSCLFVWLVIGQPYGRWAMHGTVAAFLTLFYFLFTCLW